MALTYKRASTLVNLVSLTSVQVSNAALPLLIFPFTLSVVGADHYAKVALSEGLSIVLLTLVLYSFEIDGVAQISGADRNTRHVSEAFSAILFVRMGLFAIGAPLTLLAASWLQPELVPLALGWLLVPLSYVLQSNWLFLGLERNGSVAAFTVISRCAALGFVLTFVQTPADYVLVPALVGAAYMAGAVCSLVYAVGRLEVRVVKVPVIRLKELLWSGKELFLGNVSAILFRDVNIVVLGAVGVPAAGVAAYSMAEKITKVIQASMRPLNQLYLPAALRVAAAVQQPCRESLTKLMRLTWPQVAAICLVLMGAAAAYATLGDRVPVIRRMPNRDEIVRLVGFMSIVPLLGAPNFMLGGAGLNTMGARRYMLMAFVVTAAVSLGTCVVMASRFGESGAAVAFVLSEALLLTLIMRRYLRKM